MNYKKIGENIRKERKKQNITIEELAYMSDITPNHLGKIERAQTKLSLEVLIKIINALEVTCDDIIGHEIDTVSQSKLNHVNIDLQNICKSNKDYYNLLELIISYMNSKEK